MEILLFFNWILFLLKSLLCASGKFAAIKRAFLIYYKQYLCQLFIIDYKNRK